VKKTGSIIALLDEEGVVPNGSSEGFLNKITKTFANNKRFIAKTRTRDFGIKHYAGEVTYDPTFFLSKNKDTISQDIIDVMKESRNPFIAALFNEGGGAGGAAGSASSVATNNSGGANAKSAPAPNVNKQTVGKKFSIQLEALMATLNKTQPHYIRCIKPNQVKKPDIFDSVTSNEQLTYSGIFEAVIIMQNGYPFRLTLTEFLKRYHMLVLDDTIRYWEIFGAETAKAASPVKGKASTPAAAKESKTQAASKDSKTQAASKAGTSVRPRCAALVRHAASIHGEDILNECHVGKTMVLYKSAPHKCLERLRHSVLLHGTRTAQRFYRGSIIRLIIRRLAAAVDECKRAIAAANVVKMRECSDEVSAQLYRLRVNSKSTNVRDFAIVQIAKDYATALIKEKQNEETIQRLLSNSSVPHVIASIDELCAANEDMKSVEFTAVLDDGTKLRRVWSDNPKLVEADSKIRRYRMTVDMRKSLKEAVADRDDMKVEDLMIKISHLREHHELVSGYCSDDEKKGSKIVSDAKAAFNDLLTKSIVSLTNGALTLKRATDGLGKLEFQVSASSITDLYNTLSGLPAFASTSSNSNTRAKLLLSLCKYIRELRFKAEQGDWQSIRSMLERCEVCVGPTGLSRAMDYLATTGPTSNASAIVLYAPPEIEQSIVDEIGRYRICVAQFQLVPIVQAKLQQSPALADQFSLEVPTAYLSAIKEALALLQPHGAVLSLDPFLKNLLETVEIREHLWNSLYEGNAGNIRHSMANLKSRGLVDDLDYEYAARQLQMHSVREALHGALLNEGPTGEPGAMTFDTILVESLSKALSEAAVLALKHPLWNTMVALCSQCCKLRGFLCSSNISEALAFAQGIDVSQYINEKYTEDAKKRLGESSSGFQLIQMIALCAREIDACRRELVHLKAMETLVAAIKAGAIGGEVGNIKLTKTDPNSMKAAVKSVERSLIRTSVVSRLLEDIESLSNVRKLVLADSWRETEQIVNSIHESSNQFTDCHVCIRTELLIAYGEAVDRELRRSLSESMGRCKHRISELETPSYPVDAVTDLKSCIGRIESSQHKSFETNYMLNTARILWQLAMAVNENFWEPAALFCSRMSTRELTLSFWATDNNSDQIKELIDSIDDASNFESLESINNSSSLAAVESEKATDLSKLSTAEILVHASYVGIHALVSEEFSAIKRLSFDRRCRACLLLGAVKGQVGGSIHSGFDVSMIELTPLIRALKYIKIYRSYWSKTIENWELLAVELLNARLAVLSAESVGAENKIELSSYLNLEHLNYLIENTLPGFPLSEIRFVVDNVNDILMIKSIFDALMSGRPQYLMGAFSVQHIEYEYLASLLQKSKKLRQRSDRLDRLMFYSDLCVMARKALTRHQWDDSSKSPESSGTTGAKTAGRNPGVKQCVEEYRLANKFFSLNKMENIPPKFLIDEFELLGREFEKRNILQDFSAVLQSGAIAGSPFALNFREISVTSLEAQVQRVRKWEEGTGTVDIDLETLCKACSEILQIRTQVKQIQSSYQRPTVLSTNSQKAQDIIATGFVTDCINLAITNTTNISVAPFPMIKEWEPVDKVLSRVQVVTSLRSSRQEIDLVTAETFSRAFIAKVSSIMMSLGSVNSESGISFAKANQAVIDLTYAYQSYATRMKDKMMERKSKQSYYSSPVLEMIHDSTIIFIHLLRAEQLNIYDAPNRHWRQLEFESNVIPRMSQLVDGISSQFSVQSLIRVCLPLTLHPRLVSYVKYLSCIVEDKVTEVELLNQLKKPSGRRRSMVGDMDKKNIATDEFVSAIERADTVGIHTAELKSLHESSTLVCNLRIFAKNLDYINGYEAILQFVDEGCCANFGELMTSLNRGRFSVHHSARMEFVQLTLELCDGYWRLLAEQAMLSGAVVGQRGLLRVSEIDWTGIDDVVAYSKCHLELSPESFQLLDVCFILRNLRAQVTGASKEVDKHNEQSVVSPVLPEPLMASGASSKGGKIYIVNQDFVDHVVDCAMHNVQVMSNANNISATSINFPMAFETIHKLEDSLASIVSIKQSTKETLCEEMEIIHRQLEFLQARAQLLIVSDLQSIWFTEFGLEARDQFTATIQGALSTAVAQNWDPNLQHERFCRCLLDTMMSMQLLHDQIRFTGLTAVQLCTSHFDTILPFVNGALSQYRMLKAIEDGNTGTSRIPKGLTNLASHLQAVMTECSNIDRLIAILKSDKLCSQVNYAGKFVITVSHDSTVVGLNFHSSEYGPYVLRLKLMADKIKVTTFIGKQIQKLVKMFATMRLHVKQSHFSEALALSETIEVVDDSRLTATMDDCAQVQRYCTFLTCRRSLEQNLCGCIIPPVAGWTEFGAMPVLALAINDAPLVESIENTLRALPQYATEYPELLGLMDLGLLFLRLIAAIRTKSWKTLSEVAKAAVAQHESSTAPPLPSPVAATPKPKGRRHSMLTVGLDNLKTTAAVSSAAAIGIEINSTISIIDNMPVQYRPQFAPLKNSILFHCGDTVEQIVASIKNYVRQSKFVIDDTIRSFVLQIAMQAETEIKFAELEALAVAAFKDCKIGGTPGELLVSKSVVSNLEKLITRLQQDKPLVNSCYPLKRAFQTAVVMVKVHEALARKEEGMPDVGKCLCLLSYMGSRKRLVQESKCEDYIYRECLHDETLLSIDEFSFKANIGEVVRKLKSVTSGYSQQTHPSSGDHQNEILSRDATSSNDFLSELSKEYLSCSVSDIVRLRDEFFDDLALLEQHFTLECHYADFTALLVHHAVGEPGDLDATRVEYEQLATMLHSLAQFGLAVPTCPLGSLLHMAVEAIYFVRRGQKLGDFRMLQTALKRIEVAETAENEYLAKKADDAVSDQSADGRLRQRALELGLSASVSSDYAQNDERVSQRLFISAATEEVATARQDFAQRELIIGLRKGLNEAIVTLQIISDIDVFQTKNTQKTADLPISLLTYAVNTLAKDCKPSSQKANELCRTAEALLQIRQYINAKRWVCLRNYIEALDLASISPANREEVNIALRIAVVANVVEKSGRAYKVGSIYGNPGKIENFQDIDCTVVEAALKAFDDIADNWKTVDIVIHYYSCVILQAVRKHFRQSNWLIVRDMASIALEPQRLASKPLFVSADVEIKLAFEHSTYMICSEALSHACTTGKLKGDVGSVDTSDVSVLVLNKALAISKQLNSTMPDIAVLEASAEIIRDVRQAQLLGHWISSSSHSDLNESFSIERAVITASYNVQPTDVFGHFLDGRVSPNNRGRYRSLYVAPPVDTHVDDDEDEVDERAVVIAADANDGAKSAVSHRFVVQSTLFDPDLCDLFAVAKTRPRSGSAGELSVAVPSAAASPVRSVKEIIQRARDIQNTMDLSPLILDELELAANEVQYREISFNLLKAIRTTGITGEPGALDVSKVRTHDLIDAVAAAEANSELSRKGACRWLLRDAKLLLSVRQKTLQHNWKLLSMVFRDVDRQNSPEYVDPVDKQPGLPIIMPVWKEIQLVMSDIAFQMCLAQFAQEMQNLHDQGSLGSRNSRRMVAMIKVLVTTMRASVLYPCQLFGNLVEAQSVALELRVFHNFEPEKNPVDIIHRVGEAKRRDLIAGKVSYMTLLMSDISNMSNVVDKQQYVDSLHNELINGQLYLMRPLGRIDASVLDVTRLSKALEVAMPLVSVMGSPSEIKLLRVCEASVAIRSAVKSENWLAVKEAMENPEFVDVIKSTLIHDEVDRLQCEIENFEACLLLERTMYMGRYMNVVNLARLECKPRSSVVERAMSAGEKRRVSQLPNSFFGGLESLERAMLAGNVVNRRSEILNGYLRAASLIYRIRDKMAHGQWEDLKALLQDESKYSTLPQFAMEEIRAIKAGMAYRNTMFSVCNALINGCVSGVPGNVIVSTVDAYALQQALNEAASLDMSDTATAVMYDVGTCICRLRNAVKEGRWFPAAPIVVPGTDAGALQPAESEAKETVLEETSASASHSEDLPQQAGAGHKTMAAFMFESIGSEDEDDEAVVVSSKPFSSANASGSSGRQSGSPSSGFKPFSSTSSSFGALSRGRKRSDSDSQFLSSPLRASQASVQEIVKEFMSRKDINFRLLREALAIDETEDDNDKDQDWMLQQWEALMQVEKEVDLVSGELKERKVSSSLVFALENIPALVQNFTGISPQNSKRGIPSPRETIGVDAASAGESDEDPLNIRLLEQALDECSVPSLSKATDEVSRETERLIATARLILRFRQSLLNFELDNFKELLDEARLLQMQGVLSSHYGLHELSVYRSSAVAVSIAKSKLIQNMRNGCVSGRLDAVLVEKIDSSVLYYWLNACAALSRSAKGIVGDLDAYIEEASVLIKLRDAVKTSEWGQVRELLMTVPMSVGTSVSSTEVQHIRMICKYRDYSQELTSLLEDDVAVLDSALVTRIPPLEACLKEIQAVLNYESELLPPGGPLLNDRQLRELFRMGTNVCGLWKAIRSNNWNIDGIAASRLHDIDRPRDPLLCRLFDSISQHEVARKLDTLHSQLQALGFDKTASSQPHRNIRKSIHSSLTMSGQGLNPAHAAAADRPNSMSHLHAASIGGPPIPGYSNQTVGTPQPTRTSSELLSSESAGTAAAKPKKLRRVSVMTDGAAMMTPTVTGTDAAVGDNTKSETTAKSSNRRRSISEVAATQTPAKSLSTSGVSLSGRKPGRSYNEPASSVAAILCREDWSGCPSNIRRLFNNARDRMIDLIIRTRLMIGCRDGAIQLDVDGDLVVPAMCTDLIDIVITDVSRLRSFCVRYGVTLRFWPLTESWYNTAQCLMKCRRALAFNNIEAVILEMLQQGYLGRFRKANFDNRPCHEELDRIERFLFEHMAEKAIRKAIEYLLSVPSMTVTVYYNKHIDALKTVGVLPQSMRQPTAFYTDLMTIARELRHAIAATAMGDLNRLILNEAVVLQLTQRPNFSLSDISTSFLLLFSLFKASIVGTKRFRSSSFDDSPGKSKSRSSKKSGKDGSGTDDYMQALKRDLEKSSRQRFNSEDSGEGAILRQRLTDAASVSSGGDSAKPKRSLTSLLFGSSAGAGAGAGPDAQLDNFDDIHQKLNVGVSFGKDDEHGSDTEKEPAVASIVTQAPIEFDPFCAPDDIEGDTQDFIARRLRRSVDCPGLQFVQGCEISDLCYSQFDNLSSVAQIAENTRTVMPILEKLLHEIVTFRPPKPQVYGQQQQEASDKESGGGGRSAIYSKVRSLLGAQENQSIEALHNLFNSPSVEESVIDQLEAAIKTFSPVYRLQEPLLCFAATLILQCLLVSHANRIPTSHNKNDENIAKQASFIAKFAVVPIPQCVQEFLTRLRVHAFNEYNSSKPGGSNKLKAVDYFSFAVFLRRAIQYSHEVASKQHAPSQQVHNAVNIIATNFKIYVDSTRSLANRCLENSYNINKSTRGVEDEAKTPSADGNGESGEDVTKPMAKFMGVTSRVLTLCDQLSRIVN
jgi:hypothetical protein